MALLLWLIAFDCSTLIMDCSLLGCLGRLLQSRDWKADLGQGLLMCVGATEPSSLPTSQAGHLVVHPAVEEQQHPSCWGTAHPGEPPFGVLSCSHAGVPCRTDPSLLRAAILAAAVGPRAPLACLPLP